MVQLNGLTYRMEEEKGRDYGSIILEIRHNELRKDYCDFNSCP